MKRVSRRTFLVLALVFASSAPGPLRAQERTGAVRVQVSPDRDDWTYKTGAPVTFRIQVIRDSNPLPGASVSYSYGPEMLPPKVEKTARVPKEGLVVAAGTMTRARLPSARGDGRGRRQEVPRARHRGLCPGSHQAHRGRSPGLRRLLDRGQGGSRQAADRRQADALARALDLEGRRVPGEPPERGRRRDRHQPLLRHPGRAQRARGPFPR